MRSKYPLYVVLLIFLGGLSLGANGSSSILDLFVNEALPVLAEPKIGAKEISRLVPGDQVVVSPKFYGKFRKVLITYDGHSKGGYILAAEIKKSQILPREELDAELQPRYRSKYGVGGSLVVSMLQQGGSTFEMSDNTVYSVTELKSNSFYVSAFGDWDWSQHWATRAHLSLRNTHFVGNADQKNAMVPAPRQVERDQSFLGLGLTMKHYSSEDSKWWWGIGGEAAMGTKTTIKISGVVAPTQDDTKPFYLIGYGAVGGEVPLPSTKTWFFLPDLKVGVVATTSPMTLMEELWLSLGHKL